MPASPAPSLPIHVRHVLAATDNSAEGRAAILAAARLAQRCRARMTVLTVAELAQGEAVRDAALEGLAATVAEVLDPLPTPTRPALEVALGLPGVEIGRFAERTNADLIVIGRKRRSEMQRLLLGDTADAVARRSSIPCLFVQTDPPAFERVLVGLDGTERGLSVLLAALMFARDVGAQLRVVTVEPDDGEGATPLPTGRSARLVQAIDQLRNSTRLGRGRWDLAPEPEGASPLVIRRGPIVRSLIHEVTAFDADVLVVGNHRGGPAGVIEGGSTARRLAHDAPCAVLTSPL